MGSDLTSPLQSFLRKAGNRLPANTGETATFHARLSNAGSGRVVLCDLSGSMAANAGSRRKVDLLSEAIGQLRADGIDAAWFGFHSTVFALIPGTPLEPGGGTALHLAIDQAGRLHPGCTVVISDGQPDDEKRALEAAATVSGRIDVIYCGPDNDVAAIAFMRRLAKAGCGTVIVRDLARSPRLQLAGDVRQLLSLPAPKKGNP